MWTQCCTAAWLFGCPGPQAAKSLRDASLHIQEPFLCTSFNPIQCGKEVHYVEAMDRDQVCVQRLAVELSIDPGQCARNIFVAVGVKFIPEGRTGAALKLHLGVS
ncbi:unnamed protein product [Arctogadus glacialis]